MATVDQSVDESDPQTEESGTLFGRKRGGQRGNRNAIRHGLRASQMPKGAEYIERAARCFRKYAMKELAQIHGGEIPLYQQAVLQSCVRHESRALLASRWLRLEAEKLSIEQRIALLRTISDATDSRDKCLRLLGLDRTDTDRLFASLYESEPPRIVHGDDESTSEPDTGNGRQRGGEKLSEDA